MTTETWLSRVWSSVQCRLRQRRNSSPITVLVQRPRTTGGLGLALQRRRETGRMLISVYIQILLCTCNGSVSRVEGAENLDARGSLDYALENGLERRVCCMTFLPSERIVSQRNTCVFASLGANDHRYQRAEIQSPMRLTPPTRPTHAPQASRFHVGPTF